MWLVRDATGEADRPRPSGRALSLLVLTLDGDRISHITRFAPAGALPHFGLPRTIPW